MVALSVIASFVPYRTSLDPHSLYPFRFLPPCSSLIQREVHSLPSINARTPNQTSHGIAHFLHMTPLHQQHHRRIGAVSLDVAHIIGKQRRPVPPQSHIIGLHRLLICCFTHPASSFLTTGLP